MVDLVEKYLIAAEKHWSLPCTAYILNTVIKPLISFVLVEYGGILGKWICCVTAQHGLKKIYKTVNIQNLQIMLDCFYGKS